MTLLLFIDRKHRPRVGMKEKLDRGRSAADKNVANGDS